MRGVEEGRGIGSTQARLAQAEKRVWRERGPSSGHAEVQKSKVDSSRMVHSGVYPIDMEPFPLQLASQPREYNSSTCSLDPSIHSRLSLFPPMRLQLDLSIKADIRASKAKQLFMLR